MQSKKEPRNANMLDKNPQANFMPDLFIKLNQWIENQ
jgi:hypothetical protein